MANKAPEVILTTKQNKVLNQIISTKKIEYRLHQRAVIILRSAEGINSTVISRRMDLKRDTIAFWRKKWVLAEEKLKALESEDDSKKYLTAIIEILSDSQRKGAPLKFTEIEICLILSVACEKPADCGYPVSHWSAKLLRLEVIRRSIVKSISRSHVSRILKEGSIRPHKVEEWINTPKKNTDEFKSRLGSLCNTYQLAMELYAKGIHVYCVDEKTGIQSLEREITPMKKGQPERHGFDYIRHGTQCLIANFEVATGKVVEATIGDTRTEIDFLNHIAKTVSNDPGAEHIFIVDQLNTHRSEKLVRFVSEVCHLDEELGIKGKSGILHTMDTRTAFLENSDHRIRFLFTPKHASWLNQVEIWFGILVRRLLKRLSTKSTEELKQKIFEFIDFFNIVMAKPFKWTYTGKVLSA